jgi:cellulose synthase/poly-beta-1,6-N-acetylglucosamine synthase-like glycosyltransferase
LEIIIVDDSTDNTVEVIKSIVGDDPRFILIKEEKLPDGWIGKPHALQQGSSLAKGDLLLFIDADTFHDPSLIAHAVEYACEHNVDLLSLAPHNICGSFWEKVIQPIPLCVIPAISPLSKVNKPESKVVVAFGPFMLMKHSVFTQVGGYETIKNRIADDAEMAKLVKSSGYKVNLANAQTLMHIRMYENFSEIWEGWSKNIFLGLVQKRGINSKAQRLFVALVGSVIIFGIMDFPLWITIISLFLTLFTHSPQWQQVLLFALVVWFVGIVLQFSIQKTYHIGDPKYASFAFLGGLIIIAIFLNSAIKTISGTGVTWKGRVYATKKS